MMVRQAGRAGVTSRAGTVGRSGSVRGPRTPAGSGVPRSLDRRYRYCGRARQLKRVSVAPNRDVPSSTCEISDYEF